MKRKYDILLMGMELLYKMAQNLNQKINFSLIRDDNRKITDESILNLCQQGINDILNPTTASVGLSEFAHPISHLWDGLGSYLSQFTFPPNISFWRIKPDFISILDACSVLLTGDGTIIIDKLHLMKSITENNLKLVTLYQQTKSNNQDCSKILQNLKDSFAHLFSVFGEIWQVLEVPNDLDSVATTVAVWIDHLIETEKHNHTRTLDEIAEEELHTLLLDEGVDINQLPEEEYNWRLQEVKANIMNGSHF